MCAARPPLGTVCERSSPRRPNGGVSAPQLVTAPRLRHRRAAAPGPRRSANRSTERSAPARRVKRPQLGVQMEATGRLVIMDSPREAHRRKAGSTSLESSAARLASATELRSPRPRGDAPRPRQHVVVRQHPEVRLASRRSRAGWRYHVDVFAAFWPGQNTSMGGTRQRSACTPR